MTWLRIDVKLVSVLTVLGFACVVGRVWGQPDAAGDPCRENCLECDCYFAPAFLQPNECYWTTKPSCVEKILADRRSVGTKCKEKIPLVNAKKYTCDDCVEVCPPGTTTKRVCSRPAGANTTNCNTAKDLYVNECSTVKHADPDDTAL